MNNYYNHDKNGETKLNEDTINNLNDFYIQSSLGDCNGIFNLSNFYMNHGKYFAGNNGSFSNSYSFNKWKIIKIDILICNIYCGIII